MKKWTKIKVVMVTAIILIFVVSNLLLVKLSSNKVVRAYNVDINRIYNLIQTGSQNYQSNVENSKYIKEVDILYPNATADVVADFYANTLGDYVIRPVTEGDTVLYYVKFVYEYSVASMITKVFIIVNVSLVLLSALVLLLFVYVRKRIIKPFHYMKELPYELSKGHLTKDLKENEDKMFGRFVWGLNLLRENLEQHKIHELELEKEKKC